MIRTKFEEGLKALKNSIVEMEQEVKKQLQLAVEAFISQDIEKGRVTIEMDEVIDRMEDEIEKKCIDLLALQQPIASDLRFVSSSMKIITDLERIGDYATDIAKILEFVHEKRILKEIIPNIRHMCEISIGMIETCLNAHITGDIQPLYLLSKEDDKLDTYFRDSFQEIIRLINSGETAIRALHYLMVCRNLERVGDHACNIAERVIFAHTMKKVDLK